MTNTISCAACRDYLLEFVAERLALAESAVVERHLAGCDACRRELASWHALRGAFADAAQDVPPDIASAAGWQRLRTALGTQPAAATLTLTQPWAAPAAEDDAAPYLPVPHGSLASSPLARLARRRWFSSVPAIAAVLLISLLAATLFHALGSGRSARQGQQSASAAATALVTAAATTLAPAATATLAPSACAAGSGVRANLPNASYLGDLSMVSATEGWAAGSIVGSDPTAAYPQGTLLLHYNHCGWDQGAPSIPGVVLGSISMVSASEGWAVGGTITAPEHGVALHYSDGAWQQVTLPGEDSAEGTYTLVRMLSASEGWVIFQSTKSAAGAFSFYALHYRDGAWTRVDLSYVQIGDIAPVGPDELWLTATLANGDATIAHYQAGTQTSYPLPSGEALGSFHVIAPNDIWLPGWKPSLGYDMAETEQVFVSHWDGTSWTASGLADDPAIQNVKALVVFGLSDGWAFPAPVSLSQITPIAASMRLGASGWVKGSWPFTDIIGIAQVRSVGPDEYWAIGTYMQSYIYPNGSGVSVGRTVLLHYADGTWSMYGHG